MADGTKDPALIQRKLRRPPLPSDATDRPRVEQSLLELVDRYAMVLVCATAGAGKTTAVARVAERFGRPTAWLTLDRTDRAPGRMLKYLEAALGAVVPRAHGIATRALGAGIAHAEAAGLLVEALDDEPVVLVLDEVERLGDSHASWRLVEAMARYAPAGVTIVLLSRRDIPSLVRAAVAPTAIADIGERDLAFTVAEAETALAGQGRTTANAQEAVQATGGWVTGVLLEAWRYDDHVNGTGGEVDPLKGYLSTSILGELGEAEREFLIATSLLDEVTVPRAEALGIGDAARCMRSLRERRLPVVWTDKWRGLRCHSRFREYLADELESQGAQATLPLRRAYGALLATEGLDEEATEELLAAGARAEAKVTAERAIPRVIERLDFAVADRWLGALADPSSGRASGFTRAELMLAIARDDYRQAVRIVDELEAAGERATLLRESDTTAALMAWCYSRLGRTAEACRVLDEAQPGPAVDAMRYGVSFLDDSIPRRRPSLTGGPLDTIILGSDYVLAGRIPDFEQAAGSHWVETLMSPWRVGAMQLAGRTEEALVLYEAARARGINLLAMECPSGPELLMDVGRVEEAQEALARGRHLAREGPSPFMGALVDLVEVKLQLRCRHDVRAAAAILDTVEDDEAVCHITYIRELAGTWRGLSALLEDDDATACARLEQAVDSMRAGDRLLELPTAAVYLAEAHWRLGHEEAADAAADVALEAARGQGSNHALLRALSDFPAVVSRRIDAELTADSPWHELGRALMAQGVAIDARLGTSISLSEFGQPAMAINDRLVRPRIGKCYELLAYLAAHRDAPTDREQLLDALFDGRADETARTYLRQAVHHLRKVLPSDEALATYGRRIALGPDVSVASEAARFEAELAQAARLQGTERLQALRSALTIVDGGEYLPGAESPWVEQQRRHVAELALDARYDAAAAALTAGEYDEASRLIAVVVGSEPLREAAWRLRMRIANAIGDDDGVIAAFHGCEQALATIGTQPAASTRRLLETLRR
jgi:DNA-binding SARP family transcriptional activator